MGKSFALAVDPQKLENDREATRALRAVTRGPDKGPRYPETCLSFPSQRLPPLAKFQTV